MKAIIIKVINKSFKMIIHKSIHPLIFLLIFSFILFNTSCATYSVQANNGSPDTDILGNDFQDKNMTVYFWGIFSNPEYSNGDCPSGSFNKVEVKSNALQTILGIITLGIVSSKTIRCTCAKKYDNN